MGIEFSDLPTESGLQSTDAFNVDRREMQDVIPEPANAVTKPANLHARDRQK